MNFRCQIPILDEAVLLVSSINRSDSGWRPSFTKHRKQQFYRQQHVVQQFHVDRKLGPDVANEAGLGPLSRLLNFSTAYSRGERPAQFSSILLSSSIYIYWYRCLTDCCIMFICNQFIFKYFFFRLSVECFMIVIIYRGKSCFSPFWILRLQFEHLHHYLNFGILYIENFCYYRIDRILHIKSRIVCFSKIKRNEK